MWNCSSVCSNDFRARHPHLRVIMEPGSAFAWQTGPLVAQVVDVVENAGVKTAIFNASFTCHMPDCLEMPYHRLFAGRRRSPTGWKSGTKPTIVSIAWEVTAASVEISWAIGALPVRCRWAMN